MTHKLKALGLAFVAVFAINAMAASSASAVTDHFTLGGTPTTLTGAQIGSPFKVLGQFVECTTATFHATVTGTSVTEVAGITPTYSGCTYAGNAATWTMNGCTYTLRGETDVNFQGQTHATTAIVCPAGKHITIDLPSITPNCELTVSPNGSIVPKNGVAYTNDGSGTTGGLLIHLTATVPVTGDNCAALTGSGVLTGSITMEGETETTNAHTSLSVS